MAVRHEDVYQNLSEMLESGVAPGRALETAAGTASGRLAEALHTARTQVASGESLSGAMDRSGGVFPEIEIAVIHAGEEAGSLPESLRLLAERRAFDRGVRGRFYAGMAYPLLLLHIAAFVVPLPKIVLGGPTGEYLLSVGLILACFWGPTALLVLLDRRASRNAGVRRFRDGVLLRVPILGRALRDLAVSRFCRLFHALYEAGAPVGRCVTLSADACGNAVVAEQFRGGETGARLGRPLSGGFVDMPPEFMAAWTTAEETGDLGAATSRLADTYGESGASRLTRFWVVLPVALYFLLAGVLVWHVISGFLAYFNQINDALDRI